MWLQTYYPCVQCCLEPGIDTYSKKRRIFENTATTDKALKQQRIETIEDTYITELRNKYTGFMGVKTIDLVHHLMDRYGKITETDLR